MRGNAFGPFEDEAQARAAAEAAADPGWFPIKAAENRKLLSRVLEAAGVELGAYDHRIIDWLSIWEASTVVVVAAWISRAFESGRTAAGSGSS